VTAEKSMVCTVRCVDSSADSGKVPTTACEKYSSLARSSTLDRSTP
jgi:hypothetical protein